MNFINHDNIDTLSDEGIDYIELHHPNRRRANEAIQADIADLESEGDRWKFDNRIPDHEE